jgi:photosystem II stability/assembly factor-like uncharacterized protein
MRLRLLAVIITLCASVAVTNATETEYERVRNAMQQALEQPNPDGTPRISKQFRRWEWFWQGRLHSDGSFPRPSLYLSELQKIESRKPLTDAQASKIWKELGPTAPDMPNEISTWNGIGRVNSIEVSPTDPNLLFAGTAAGGIWKSTNNGGAWTPVNITAIPVIGISDIAISTKAPLIMYAATGDANGARPGDLTGYPAYTYGIIKSTDGGNSWAPTGLTYDAVQNAVIARLWIDPRDENIVVAATYSGIMRTTDGGKSWKQQASGTYRDLIGNPSVVSVLYASTYRLNGGAQILRSTDAGVTWEATYSIPGANRIRLAVTKANANVVAAVASNYQSQGLEGVYKSTDGGKTFAELPTNLNLLGWNADGRDSRGQGFYDLAMEISPTNANVMFVGGINAWRTTNNGSSWVLSAHWTGAGGAPWVHADHHYFKFHPTQNRLYSTHDGGIARSTDQGISWRDISNGMKIQQYYGLATSNTNPSLTIAGAQDNGTALSKNNGSSFVHTLDGDGMMAAIDYVDPSIMYGSQYYGAFWRTTNQGTNWTFASNQNARGDNRAAWVAPIAADPKTQGTVYIGYGNVYKSTNAGSSWSKISNISSSVPTRWISVAPSDPKYIYVAYDNALWFTTNGGTNWQQQTGLSGFIMGVEVHPTDPKTFYVALGGFSAGQKLMRVSNGTVTNLTGNGLPNVPCNTVVYQRGGTNRLFVGTDLGVFFSDEGSGFWQPYGTGMPPIMVSSMRLISTTNILRVATYGRGVWEIDVKQCTAATPTVKALTATTVCSGDSVMLEANTGFTSYRWSNGDTNRRIVLKGTNATASYSVGVEDANGCRAVSSPVNVVINKLPAKPLINVVGKDSLRSTAFGGVSVFQWYKDGVKIDGATSRIYVTNVAGSYTVDVFTAEGCSSRSDAFVYDPNVLSVNEQSLNEMLTVAPQPALDQVTVTLPVWSNRVVEVFSITGERVLVQAIPDDATTFGVSTLLWSPGAYIVRMNAANGTASTSLIKH